MKSDYRKVLAALLAGIAIVSCNRKPREGATPLPPPQPRVTTSAPPSPQATSKNDLKLLPVDEAANDPSFAAFRVNLLDIVRRRDTAALLELLDHGIRISFGDEDGKETFRSFWKPDDPKSRLWPELEAVLTRGGSFQEMPNGWKWFCAPYSYSSFPENIDSYNHLVILGTNVPLRARPEPTADTVVLLDHDIVEIAPDEPRSEGEKLPQWRKVILTDKTTGWVHRTDYRSPLDYRACFQKKGGEWKMVVFVAGD